jgi:hypothetical protein
MRTMPTGLALSLLALAALLIGCPTPAHADVLYSCTDTGSGDGIWNGFYVEDYNGETLGTVTLSYHTNHDVGTYVVSLTAHEGSFDGPVIGTAEVTFDESGLPEAVFDFHDTEVNSGVTIAFVQHLESGPQPATVYYYVGTCLEHDEDCTACLGFYETDDYQPPLSTVKRRGLDIIITGQATTPVEPMTWGRLRSLYRETNP